MSLALFQSIIQILDMVRTRGGSRLRPRVRFSTPERGAHHRRSLFGCFGCSSSSFRPTTTTAVRWLGFFYDFCIVTSFINCLLILIRIYVLAIVGSDTFVCLALYSCTSHFGDIKSYSVYIYTDFCILCFVPLLCIIVFLFN